MSSPRHDIAFVISNLSLGGAQRVAATMASELAGHGYSVCVVTFDGPEEDLHPLAPTVTRIVVGGGGVSRHALSAVAANIGRVRRLRAAIRQARPATVVSFITVTNVLTILSAAGLSIRVVVSERNDPTRQEVPRPWRILRRILYPRADCVTANSAAAVQWLASFVSAEKLAVLPNPMPQLPELATGSHADLTILAVGRLAWQKGHDVLLEAFAEIAHLLPDWSLTVVGDGELASQLEALAVRLGISDRVTFTGRLKDPADWYRRSKIFALPSRFEGTPNALLEAMAYGLPPVVTASSSGALDFVSDNETGIIVPSDDPAALAQAIMRIAQDESLASRLGTAARERVSRHDNRGVVRVWEEIAGIRS